MTWIYSHFVDDVFSQFFAYLWQLINAQFAQIIRIFDIA